MDPEHLRIMNNYFIYENVYNYRRRVRLLPLPSREQLLPLHHENVYFPLRNAFRPRMHASKLQVSMIPVQMMQPSSDGSSMKIWIVAMFRYMLISSGAQLGRSGI
ncbi:hypothetical protein VPH35_026843 [Triticum aestivum]